MFRILCLAVLLAITVTPVAGFTTTPDPHVPDLPTTTGSVVTLLCDGNYLYVGGGFTQIGGVARCNLAAVNARNCGDV